MFTTNNVMKNKAPLPIIIGMSGGLRLNYFPRWVRVLPAFAGQAGSLKEENFPVNYQYYFEKESSPPF